MRVMTREGLAETVESLGLKIRAGKKYNRKGKYLFVYNNNDHFVADVSEDNLYEVNTSHYFFGMLEDKVKIDLLDALSNFAHTPIIKRCTEKRYIYEFLTAITSDSGGRHTYHIARHGDAFMNGERLKLDNSGEDYAIKEEEFHFTDKEVEKYSEKREYKLLFESCKRREVF